MKGNTEPLKIMKERGITKDFSFLKYWDNIYEKKGNNKNQFIAE